MMLRFLAVALLLLPIRQSQAAPPITGLWLTQGHDGVMAVSSCGSYLCVRLVGVFLDHPTDPTPVDYRGVTQCNLPLVADARQIQPNLWKGHITDPRDGRVWGVELHVDPRGNLALRGFLGVPLLGQTQTWTRYPGTPPTDCRIVAPASRQHSALPNRPGQAQ
jgi:uncharacterized protein (DUF2147 family)